MATIELTEIAPSIQLDSLRTAFLSFPILLDGEVLVVSYPLTPIELAYINAQAAKTLMAVLKINSKTVELTECELAEGFPVARVKVPGIPIPE